MSIAWPVLRARPPGLGADLDARERVRAWARAEAGGPSLAGTRFALADAFFVPVAFRLRHYAPCRPGPDGTGEKLLSHPAADLSEAEARDDSRRTGRYAEL